MKFELHCHSSRSDGELEPAAVAARARAAKADVFCLTDHDTTAGYGATREARGDMVVLRGLELSCHYERRAVHILVYDVAGDARWDKLEEALVSVAQARRKRVRTMAARLVERGIVIDVDALLARAGDKTVGRPDVARALVEVGAVSSAREAFDRYLHDGGPIDVPTSRLGLDEGVALAAETGARLALAHPHVHGPKRAAQILRRTRPLGVTGLEVHYSLYNAGQRKEWQKLADELSLVATAGSDFHADHPRRVFPLGVELEGAAADSLREWLGL